MGERSSIRISPRLITWFQGPGFQVPIYIQQSARCYLDVLLTFCASVYISGNSPKIGRNLVFIVQKTDTSGWAVMRFKANYPSERNSHNSVLSVIINVAKAELSPLRSRTPVSPLRPCSLLPDCHLYICVNCPIDTFPSVLISAGVSVQILSSFVKWALSSFVSFSNSEDECLIFKQGLITHQYQLGYGS